MRAVYPMKCQIRAEGGATRVDVYDDIGEGGWFDEGLTAKSFVAQLSGVKGALEVHINSGGGNVFDGIAIGNAIRKHKGAVTTVVDGLAASIASVIAQAGQDRVMQPGSMMMVHDAFGMCIGDAAEMAKMADTLDKNSDNLATIYADRAGGTPAQWRDTMRSETWYTAEQAVTAGLADRVEGPDAVLPAGLDLAAFTALPGRIAAALRTMPSAAATHEPMTGTHSHPHPAYGTQGGDALHSHEHTHDGDASHQHSHAASAAGHGGQHIHAAAMHGDHERYDPDGDGDCDACPEGDTDNDYWAPDGTQLKPVPGKPMTDAFMGEFWAAVRQVIRDAASGVDSSPWDASKAWHAGAESDDPAAFYAGICAGKKAGDPATQEAHALPYKYHPGDSPNAAGVKAALGRLPQTDGLTNASEAKSLLQGLMKKINPDYKPEDHAPDLSGMSPEQFRAALRGAGE